MSLVQHIELYYYSEEQQKVPQTDCILLQDEAYAFTLSHSFLEEKTRAIPRYQPGMGSSGHWHFPLVLSSQTNSDTTLRLLNNYQGIKNIYVCAYIDSSSLCAFHSYIARGHARSRQIIKRADFFKKNTGSSVNDAKYLQQPLRLQNLKGNMLLSKA